MVLGTHHEVWPAIRRIGEARGRIAALEDIRLRLIEMGEIASAEATAAQIERLRKGLDYHQHVLVAMRARLARAHAEPVGLNTVRTPHGSTYLAAPLRHASPRRDVDDAA
jgi:hypothetical protein